MGALLLCLSSCSQVEDARHVVAEADSLRAAGVAYSDSATIAEAAATLEHVRLIYPTDYAHANYYYGRILREAGNHPEAMLAFLRVVHSRTQDHEFKGRSYCNMGIMCGLAVERELAYDMYECSAYEFLEAKDSVAYYYGLIDMAFALAEQKRKDESVAITNQIENECTDANVLTKIWEMRAEAYKNAEMYDSTIYCVRELYARGYDDPTGYMMMAQAYSSLGQDDSAVYYAHKTIEKSNYYGYKYNALYILTHSDTTLTKQEILTMTSERADISLKKLTPDREKLAIAVDFLRKDLNRKPDHTWLWTLVIILIIAIPGSIYISRTHKKRQLFSRQFEKARREHQALTKQNRQLEQQQTQRQEMMLQELETNRLIICNSHDWQKELQWADFDAMCETVNKHFFLFADKLKATNTLDEKEIRLCVLVFLDMFTLKQMAATLSYSETGIRTYKSRVNEKLGNKGHDLRNFLIENVILGASEEREM